MSLVRCPTCEEPFKNLSMHWNRGKCDYPKIDRRHWEIIAGLMMAGGHILNAGNNPWFSIGSTNREFLEWLNTELGCLSRGVSLKISGQESAKRFKKFGVSSNINPDNYNPVYELTSRSHPELKQFQKWHQKGRGDRIFPPNFRLSPMIMKMWYTDDGKYESKRIRIQVSGHRHQLESLQQLFKPLPFSPKLFEMESKSGKAQFRLDFSKEDSQKLFEYMGNPIPGFENKWPSDMRGTPEKARMNVYYN